MYKNINILVVDDEKTNIKYVSKLLEDKYTIKVAYNGEQALNIISKIPIDLILLDIQMPIMDGYDTIKNIKNNPDTKDIPVIFLTSSKDDDTLVKVFQLGASDYISKPFNKEELKVRIRNHLQNYCLQKEVQLKIKQINSILNQQDNLVILSDGSTIEFANKTFLEFFGCESIEDFFKKNKILSDIFVTNDKFFHTGTIDKKSSWIDDIVKLEPSEQVVNLLSTNFILHAFSVKINKYEDSKYVITFTDISATILNQIELEDKIIHDKLTKAFNREYFEKNYVKLLKTYNTKNSNLAIALLDLDKFKIVNDTYGHAVGDDVLAHFVQTITKYSRDDDILVRWGGEEFILILKVKSINDLEKILENLRKFIELEKFPTIGKLTCSLGASIYKDDEEIENTIKRADKALYRAKDTGRNKVEIF